MSSDSKRKKGGFSRFAKESVSFFRRQRRNVAFPYQPLKRSDIRLINILPGGPDDQISCTLDQVPLDDDPDYDALSYVWGDPTLPAKQILLEGHLVDVTPSLHSALWQFRQLHDRSYEKRYLWVDAKCLNQEDNAELALQVPRMKDIYSKANDVVIWLGFNTVPENELRYLKEEMDVACEWHEKRLRETPKGKGSVVKEYPFKERLQEQGDRLRPAFRDIWERPWFTRMWVVQEAILAQRDPVVYLGPIQMQLRVLGVFDMFTFELLERKDKLAVMEIMGIAELFLRWNLQEADEATLEQRVAGMLQDSLLRLAGRDQGRPHDRVYGLLGLAVGVARGDLPTELLPNYDLPFEKVFHKYVSFIIRQTGELSLIPCTSRDLPNTVPSWVPDLRHSDRQFRTEKGPVSLSDDGLELRVEGSIVGVAKAFVPPWKPDGDPLDDDTKWPTSVQSRKTALEEIILEPASKSQATPPKSVWEEWIYYNDTYYGEDTLRSTRAYDAVESALADLAHPIELTRIRKEALEGIQCPHLLLNNHMAVQVLRDVEVMPNDIVYKVKGLYYLQLLRPKGGDKYEIVGRCVVMDRRYHEKDEQRNSQSLTLI